MCEASSRAVVTLLFMSARTLNRKLLARVLEVPESAPELPEYISGVTHDSRMVSPGFAFVAVPGFRWDGTEFVPEALRRGAGLVLAERETTGLPNGAPLVLVRDARATLAALSCAFYGDPSSKMNVYGVTGTNGKTTTSYALHAILASAFGERECGLTTTAETVYGGARRAAARTTPESVEVQATLAEMLDAGVKRVVMEVSSHGVALKRVAGVRFSGALFTNLTRDHLDLHGTMEEYYAAKRELFLWAGGPLLANSDDEWGRRLAREAEGTLTFGMTEGADYLIRGVQSIPGGMGFTLQCPERPYFDDVLEIETPLLGAYNVSNVAGAAALALETGVSAQAVSQAVREMPQVPGRFERVATGRGFEVVVDYAHTDVGLEAVLKVARGVAEDKKGRVICVFGAAGDRDKAKRPLMGRVAASLADFSIVTTDDAYSEDPAVIAREVEMGAREAGGRYEIVLKRRAAIRRAMEVAVKGDVVVVAGKGHEQMQHLPDGDEPFHDPTVIRQLIAEMRG